MEPCLEAYTDLARAFAGCKGLESLSGLWDPHPYFLPAIYPACLGLTYLNLSHATLGCPDLIKLLRHCPNLQRLWVLDYIEDRGLEEVAASCKGLQELRVLVSDPYDADPSINLTERGLVAVTMGCPRLHSILYFCRQMTNVALLEIAKNRPNLTSFRICVLEPLLPDYLTQEPLDNGFIAILELCRSLKVFATSCLVTDRLLEHIGAHGKKLKRLVFIFAGSSDLGLHHVLSGCSNLRKLVIRDSPFDCQALLANSNKLERMRSIWMSSCKVSYRACKLLAGKHPSLNVEVMNEKEPVHSLSDASHVENLYVYRTIAGPRSDMPSFVLNANRESIERKE